METCKLIGMIGTEGYEKIRRVYDTDHIHPAIAGGGESFREHNGQRKNKKTNSKRVLEIDGLHR